MRQQKPPILQVTTTVLKSGEKIESDLVVVGVGAKPNIELLKGQVDMLEDKPGGVKVQVPKFNEVDSSKRVCLLGWSSVHGTAGKSVFGCDRG